MIILSVDLGDSRTGVAVCDKLEMLASPVTVIHERYVPKILDRICQIAGETGAERIVVGYPKNMNGSAGERAEKCAAFARDLSQACGKEAVLWDERLTTVSAHSALSDSGVYGKKRKAIVDSVAAVMILQSYLDHRRLQHEHSV